MPIMIEPYVPVYCCSTCSGWTRLLSMSTINSQLPVCAEASMTLCHHWHQNRHLARKSNSSILLNRQYQNTYSDHGFEAAYNSALIWLFCFQSRWLWQLGRRWGQWVGGRWRLTPWISTPVCLPVPHCHVPYGIIPASPWEALSKIKRRSVMCVTTDVLSTTQKWMIVLRHSPQARTLNLFLSVAETPAQAQRRRSTTATPHSFSAVVKLQNIYHISLGSPQEFAYIDTTERRVTSYDPFDPRSNSVLARYQVGLFSVGQAGLSVLT